MEKIVGICRIQSKDNSQKYYLIKRTKCRHYYINEEINGKVFYKKWQKIDVKYVAELIREING